VNTLLAIARADADERTRRFAFILTIVVALYGAYLYVPDLHAPYLTISFDGHRGAYNSAWMGLMTAVLSCSFLSLIGFYLVRGSLQRDRELGTDGIVASTPVGKLPFVLGKWLSNTVVLVVICAIMFAAAMVMQLIRGEDRHIDLSAYLVPFALIVAPGMAFVSAIATLTDSIKMLRGAGGAILYFGIWGALLSVPLSLGQGTAVTPLDPLGFTPAMHMMATGVWQAFPHANVHEVTVGGGMVPRGGVKTFVFSGGHWTAALGGLRIAWLAVAVLLASLAAVFFNRFTDEESAPRGRFAWNPNIGALVPNVYGLRLFRAEVALLFNGTSVWWLMGAMALLVAGAVLPLAWTVRYVLPVALVWPLERWASLGARERRWNVTDILVSTPHPVMRSIFAQWAAGATMGIVVCAGYLARLVAAGDVGAAAACVAAICAIAIAALACGLLTGSSRLFEGAYLIVWYLGPINHLDVVDFASATLAAPVTLLVCAAAVAGGAVLAAIFGRLRAYAR
jgi:hypothetical protein